MTKRILMLSLAMVVVSVVALAQTFSEPTTLFLIHSSGNHLKMGSDKGGFLEAANAASPQKMTISPTGDGYYTIEASGKQLYLSKYNSWNTLFVSDAAQDNAKFSIEQVSTSYVRLRCKGNNKYLGTDGNEAEAKVYSDKDGSDVKHYWYFSTEADATARVDTLCYGVSPALERQWFDGWGVSLCWWANMCGKWSDSKIDQIVDWLVSPTGLNYSIFRYNIGGGDDPQNRNCTLHHMGNGKGLRAEMEGFKDFSGDTYHWDRDAAQRKIMLKIKEKRPDAVFEAFSNSCPWYMTYSGCVAGNVDGGKDNLKPEYYEEFAHYLVDVCKHYKDEYGIEFKTLEPFNESATTFWYANGVQEGCHFDYSSQVAFIRVLEPILKASGLSTVISASDETNIGIAVGGFLQYKSAGVLQKVGQWNTHSYSGSNPDRVHMAFLARQAGMTLWMSEVGAGGSGIAGNLSLAQKLIDDMRYMQPEAWIDWQYIEEANDQWCTVRGSFSAQTFNKVKNYYVRQQFSRFIPHGSTIITSLNNQSLAALNPTRDTLVLVLLNTGSRTVHRVDLSQFEVLSPESPLTAYRTTQSLNLAKVNNVKVSGSELTLPLPEQSITTVLVPCRPSTGLDELRTDCDYIIVPRHETTRAITANERGEVTLQDIDTKDEGQLWRLVADGPSYVIRNARGQRLSSHRSSGSSSLDALTATTSEQSFSIQPLDRPYVKISPSRYSTYALDLSNESTAAGTKICTWEYANSDTPTHRQWMLFPVVSADDVMTRIAEAQRPVTTLPDGVYDLLGRCVHRGQGVPSRGQLRSGIYVVRSNNTIRKIFVE